MKRLPPRWRSFLELMRLSAHAWRSFLVGVVGFAVGLASFVVGIFTAALSDWLGIGAFVLGIVSMVLSYASFKDSLKTTRAARRELAFGEVDAGRLIARIPREGTAYRGYTRTVFRSQHSLHHPAVDAALAGAAIPLRVKPGHFGVPARVAQYQEAILWDRFWSGATLFNGILARLASDLDPDTLHEGADVQETGYFAGECTNELAGREILRTRAGGHSDVEYRGWDAMTKDGRLSTLADDRCANIVGTSTLAITRDARMVILRQTRGSGQSPRLLAPSGSGSADPTDWQGGGANLTVLQQFAAKSMGRELEEETGLPGQTRVIGFARVLSRGGKPEFFGVSRLADDWAAVQVAGEELAYMSVPESPVVELRDAAAFIDSLRRFERANSVGFSLPLHLNLHALIRYAERDWGALKAFLDGREAGHWPIA